MESSKPVLGDMLMSSKGIHRVEGITGVAGRRYWPASETRRIVEENLAPAASVSGWSYHQGLVQERRPSRRPGLVGPPRWDA